MKNASDRPNAISKKRHQKADMRRGGLLLTWRSCLSYCGSRKSETIIQAKPNNVEAVVENCVDADGRAIV
jgi:hypothetical protein